MTRIVWQMVSQAELEILLKEANSTLFTSNHLASPHRLSLSPMQRLEDRTLCAVSTNDGIYRSIYNIMDSGKK